MDSSKDNNFGYDMIIGQDLMNKLVMFVDFRNENLICEDVIVPMWSAGNNCPKPILKIVKIKPVAQQISDPIVTMENTERVV